MTKSSCLSILLVATGILLTGNVAAELDPQTGRFFFRESSLFPDDTLGHIALFLMKQNRLEGKAYVSQSVEEGIVGYQIRFYDNGNELVDDQDRMSIRRYTIAREPAQPPGAEAPEAALPGQAPGPGADVPPAVPKPAMVETRYIEYVDFGLNGLDESDHFFLNGRRFDLAGKDAKTIREYRSQVATAINVFIEQIKYETIVEDLGSSSQTAIRKRGAYDDGSLPSLMVFGIDLPYVFKPIVQQGRQLDEARMLEEIRQRIGFVYSATVGYTDLSGYRFRDLADQTPLLQREYDEIERTILTLIIEALFDKDGDGLITQESISNGYTRFRELHQQLSDNARGQNLRIILPNAKLARLRKEYESVHQKPFSP